MSAGADGRGGGKTIANGYTPYGRGPGPARQKANPARDELLAPNSTGAE